MQDYFDLLLSGDQIHAMSTLGMAHIGDAVYELMVRSWLCLHGKATGKGFHKAAVGYVKAPTQAKSMERILPLLTEEETAVYQRGRNARVNSIPQNATRGEYLQATALEALFGYLWLKGRRDRLNELFSVIMEGES